MKHLKRESPKKKINTETITSKKYPDGEMRRNRALPSSDRAKQRETKRVTPKIAEKPQIDNPIFWPELPREEIQPLFSQFRFGLRRVEIKREKVGNVIPEVDYKLKVRNLIMNSNHFKVREREGKVSFVYIFSWAVWVCVHKRQKL